MTDSRSFIQISERRGPLKMSKLLGFILVFLVAIIVGGAIYISIWDVPAPVRTVEKVLPDDMLGK